MDNTTNLNPELREYRFFLDHYRKGLHREADYTGIVSWKFGQKTRTEGKVFVEFIRTHPGYDVYFINPYPHEVFLFRNVWLQGEACHPGLIDFVQAILTRLDYDVQLREIENDHDTALYCNFWVGNAFFWDEYMAYTQPIFDYLLNRLSKEERGFLDQPADKARDTTATYLSFIMERLFSTFLSQRRDIKALAYVYPCRELQIIHTMRDNHWAAVQRMQQAQQLPRQVDISSGEIPRPRSAGSLKSRISNWLASRRSPAKREQA